MNPMLRKGGKCPQCLTGRLVPIFYGHPDAETLALSEQGMLLLGGGVKNEVFDEVRIQYVSLDPQIGCPNCQARFFRDGRRARQ